MLSWGGFEARSAGAPMAVVTAPPVPMGVVVPAAGTDPAAAEVDEVPEEPAAMAAASAFACTYKACSGMTRKWL